MMPLKGILICGLGHKVTFLYSAHMLQQHGCAIISGYVLATDWCTGMNQDTTTYIADNKQTNCQNDELTAPRLKYYETFWNNLLIFSLFLCSCSTYTFVAVCCALCGIQLQWNLHIHVGHPQHRWLIKLLNERTRIKNIMFTCIEATDGRLMQMTIEL